MPDRDDVGSLERATTDFLAARPRLFGIAYRVLGSATEAEDTLQEAWVKWQKVDRDAVDEPAAFLTTLTTRLALNTARSARVRRETYVGPWLPEPVDTSADPELGAERAEAVELAVLHLLEKLPPTERAAYVLREAFELSLRADRGDPRDQSGQRPAAGEPGPQASGRGAAREGQQVGAPATAGGVPHRGTDG